MAINRSLLLTNERKVLGSARSTSAIVQLICDIVQSFENRIGAKNIPVGIGHRWDGATDDGFVFESPHLGWKNVTFGAELKTAIGTRHLNVENDVNAIVVGEFHYGAGQGADNLLAVYFGTGIGSGIIANQQLVRGMGTAAEIGHTKVVYGDEGRPCDCGSIGCMEAYVGGVYLQKRIRQDMKAGIQSALSSFSNDIDGLHPGHLDQAASDGDAYALGIYEEIAPLAGAALANAITLLNPERLVIGGGLMSRTPI